MPKLLHFALDPYGRRTRLALAEYGVEVELVEEKPWTPSEQLFNLNPSLLTPVFIEDTGEAICGAEAVTEYLEETKSEKQQLIRGDAFARAEIRRLVAWFDVKFYTEVTEPILTEKIIRRFVRSASGSGSPDMTRVRRAREAMKAHLDYIGMLADERTYLAGEHLSLGDLAAAAHISAIDYIGDIPWTDVPAVHAWYSRIKSRPSFRALLTDTISNVPPSANYANLDF
jgi:glutathione S-transferase